MLLDFFYKYEEYLCNINNIPFDPRYWSFISDNKLLDTIEHIFPQTPDKSWQGKMGSGKNTIERNVHRLGNLIVLPQNINQQCSNKSFLEKKKIYETQPCNYIKDIINCSDWTKDNIDEREEKLLNTAKQIWK